jgi:methionyl aminopeptidase
MVLCIEPMLMIGSDQYVVDPKNNWTVSSANNELTCHEEHMVLVTNTGHEVLTAN